MGNEVDKAIEAAADKICDNDRDYSGAGLEQNIAIIRTHIMPVMETMKAEINKNNRIANEALDDACVEAGKVLALETELADLKERADIGDSIHKEMMEKLGTYKKCLEDIVWSEWYGAETLAKDALDEAAKLTTTKGVEHEGGE